jgi:type VI protein secretion system component Hcp
MPSDAYMKLDGIRGETKDDFESGWAAFEISSLSFSHTPDDSESGNTPSQPNGKAQPATSGRSSPANKGPSMASFSITKGLDYASPNLIRRCCDRQPFDWGIVYFREMGDPGRIPYLVLEFTKLHIKDFKWELDPAAGGEEAAKVETISFDFETLLIKYAKQLPSGEHDAAHLGMWNFKKNNGQVDPIPNDSFLGEHDE